MTRIQIHIILFYTNKLSLGKKKREEINKSSNQIGGYEEDVDSIIKGSHDLEKLEQ